MTRVLRKTNIRVVVEPRREGDFGWMSISGVGTPESNERHALSEAARIVDEVRRHVDDFSSVYIDYDLETHCVSGGFESVDAEGDSRDRWPTCCDADQLEFFRAHESESDEWFAARGVDDFDYLAELREGEAS